MNINKINSIKIFDETNNEVNKKMINNFENKINSLNNASLLDINYASFF